MFNDKHNQIETIVDMYQLGLSVISEDNHANDKCFYRTQHDKNKKMYKEVIKFIISDERNSHLMNPDLFYLSFQLGLHNDFVENLSAFNTKFEYTPQNFINTAVSVMPSLIDSDEQEQVFSENYQSLDLLTDEMLKEQAKLILKISDIELSNQSASTIFTKVNHGHWEFLLNSFLDISDYNKYRDLTRKSYPISLKFCGFHSLFSQSFRYFMEPETNGRVKVAVGINAGERSLYSALEMPFTPCIRGALVGLLGFINTIKNTPEVSFYDGSATRDFLKNGEYKKFFKQSLSEYDALLLLVPPGLKGLSFPSFKGKVHHLIMPGQVVQELYRVLIPTVIGGITNLTKKHKKICILVQAAAFAPLLAYYIDAVFKPLGIEVALFDLGRVFDVVKPELIEKTPSLKWTQDMFEEISECFELKPENAKFTLTDVQV
ncbi:hypothetical protein AADZ91_01845 [Colwelliaceae bacterium 6441]